MTDERTDSFMKPKITMFFVSFLLAWPLANATVSSQYARQSAEWFRSEEGHRIANNVLTWQSLHGSWPKNGDTASRPYEGDRDELDGTFDNGATIGELRFLARAVSATGASPYELAFKRGLDHILEAQYPTGGWPQFFPLGQGYHRHITFNDNAMVRILEFLQDVGESTDYAFLDKNRRADARAAFDKGIQCILDCQIVVNEKRTVWCAQHDEVTLKPRPARSYELESLSGGESAAILGFLMSLDNPDPGLQVAIRAGVAWYESAKIKGIRVEKDQGGDRVATEDPDAPSLWARFYEIETNRPFFCDRDGLKKYRYNDVEAERRNGYRWYGNWGEKVAVAYQVWTRQWLATPHKAQ
jgi:pectate lyase